MVGFAWVPAAPWLAERLLFLPDGSDPGPAPVLAGVQGRDVTLQTADDVRIHGWWHPRSSHGPAVLLLHGNAGNIAGRIPLAEAYLARGVSVFMLDYRGYGRSEGRPFEEGLYRDVEAALDFLEEEVGSGAVTIHGRSLGAAAAAPIAAHREVGGVILDSAFTSLADIAGSIYPVLPSFLLRPLTDRFDTRSAVPRIDAPILVVHGTADELVPVRMGLELFEAAGEPRTWYPIEGAGHNDVLLVGGDAYFDRLASFALDPEGSGNGGEELR